MITLWRRGAAELTGTAALVIIIVGSGIMAQRLSADGAIRLLANSTATALGLAVLIAVFGAVSGAHFNPVVSLADYWFGRTNRAGLTLTEVGAYIVAQTAGAIVGAVVANLMFSLPAVDLSHASRTGAHLWLAEAVATTGLLVVIVSLVRNGRTAVIPAAVGAYIGSAYWFTSSTSFANPAVTIGRAFTDTYAGISPGSVPGFVAAQGLGLLIAVGLLAVFHPADQPKPPSPTTVATDRRPEHV